jgi:hypothetical protein
VPVDDHIEEYRKSLAGAAAPFVRPRRFIAAESWTKATTQDGTRYLGLFREHEPDLPAVLGHPHVLILGEPGAGKSTTGRAIVQHILDHGQPTEVPVLASLKSYHGNLRDTLLRTIPAAILDATGITRTYILDGIDEVPTNHRAALTRDINDLLAADTSAKIVLTARQAFFAQHPEASPPGLTAYHLLDFDNEDIRACATHQGIDAAGFLAAVRNVDCEEEIRNPFVLTVMLERFQQHGSLSPLRSDNVAYVVDRLIHSRPLVNAKRQQRALRMLATTCETAARNELADEEALRVLCEAIDFPPEAARQLLDELSQSILIRTAGGISFQMRSYGEYLAADELHDKPVDRLKELAFINNTPLDTWLNTVTYLAEMNNKVQAYFARHHPTWLVNVSPAAFTDDERTTLTRQLLRDINQAQAYLIDQHTIPLRRLARLLTPAVVADLRAQLTSTQPHEVANALVLLGLQHDAHVVPQALRLATEHRNPTSLRYAAIIALINADADAVIDDLIAFADPTDAYYIHIIDAIGSLCTPADFPRVLPLLERTKAGLSSAYYHFRELKSKDALAATIAYLTDNPGALNGHDLDSYLGPIIDLIPTYWDDEIGTAIGLLLAAIERHGYLHGYGELPRKLMTHVAAMDHSAVAITTMLMALARDGKRVTYNGGVIAPLITQTAAAWIKDHAPQYANDLFPWLPPGRASDLLDQRSPETIQAHDAVRDAYLEEQRRREQETVTTQTQHQTTIQTGRNINAIIGAWERLPKEHRPALSSAQRDWLAQRVTDELVSLDLARSITWHTENTWTQPRGLNPLLDMTDYYNLAIANDVPVVLALRAWPHKAISNYYRRVGLTTAAQEQLEELLRQAENNITSHAISFLRDTGYDTPAIRELLKHIALDTAKPPQLRIDATERLTSLEQATDTLLTLMRDQVTAIRDHAFRHLVKAQHQATIRQALATLTDDALRAGEVQIPNSTPLDWIGNITATFAINDLRTLRQRTLRLTLWRVTTLVTATMATIDKTIAARTITQQLPHTPPAWQLHFVQEADKLERAARLEAVQQTPFDTIIRKLKGATSMISVKVWCEGPTDRPVLRKLFREIGENDIAATMDFVGGWASLLSEHEPEHWLDGCRQAVIIMDGDVGRKLKKKNRPLTDQARQLNNRFANHPITLHVLERYGIENYLPQHAYETILGRDLSTYFPIPHDKKIEEHFREPQPCWRRCLNWVRRRKQPSFYQKHLNEQAAKHLAMADVEGTDLAAILNNVKQRAEDARQF